MKPITHSDKDAKVSSNSKTRDPSSNGKQVKVNQLRVRNEGTRVYIPTAHDKTIASAANTKTSTNANKSPKSLDSTHSSSDSNSGSNMKKINDIANLHSILVMTDEEFRSTRVSDMLRRYGQASGGGSCSIDFGAELMDRWKREKKTVCKSYSEQSQSGPHMSSGTNKNGINSENSSISGSSTDCYFIK